MADVDLNEMIEENSTKDKSAHKHKGEHHDAHKHAASSGKDMKSGSRSGGGGSGVGFWIAVVAAVALAVLLVASIETNGFHGAGSGTSGPSISADELRTKTQAYLQTLLPAGQNGSVDSVVDQGNIYAVKLTVAGRPFESYVTKDGKYLFPSGIDMSTPAPAQNAAPAAAAQPENIPKADKPAVELFVMSYCPYGTQAEKGILPAIRALGDKVDFKVRIVSYAMHGQKEVMENLNQYCIQKEQPDKYLGYLACFLNASDQASCLAQAKVDTAKLNTCKTAADSEFQVTANFNDQSKWLNGQFPVQNFDKPLNDKYGVQGSPTLVINGVQSSAGRDSVSYLQAICGAMNSAAPECQSQVPTTTPGPGFGYDTTAAASAAGCGV